jgi:hypothetical protein
METLMNAEDRAGSAKGEPERYAAARGRTPLSRRLLILLPFAAALASCQRKEPGRRRFTGYGAWESDGGGED